ncbi:MAG: zinc-binding dehydrogenase [Anaerolineae bacterium]
MAILEAPVPKPMSNEVLIEVKAAGICGTDIHIKHDQFPYWPPVIMGHEFSGVVVEVGSEVTGFQVGDRVVGEPHTRACGKCELCRTGNIQLCAHKRSPGWGINGAFARYLTMPEHLLHRIPDSMSFEEGALVEPAANVIQDVLERGRVEPNDFVVVNGPGPIGLLSVMAAKAGGAGTVVLVGITADEEMRLPVARELGVDRIIVADQQDPVEAVMDLTGGRGADLIVEASGAPSAVLASVGMVRRLGRITAIGLTGQDEIAFPWDAAAWKVCTIIFNLSTGYTCWDRTIGLIASNKLDVARIISHVEPLEAWERVFEEVENMRALKALLIP